MTQKILHKIKNDLKEAGLGFMVIVIAFTIFILIFLTPLFIFYSADWVAKFFQLGEKYTILFALILLLGLIIAMEARNNWLNNPNRKRT